MTSWSPELKNGGAPKYRAIADAIAEGVRNGDLAPGDRLPTHREMASRLGVSIGAVTRAYKLVDEWGLVSGEVGRGTFIRRLSSERVRFDARDGVSTSDAIDLAHNVSAPIGTLEREMLRAAYEFLARHPEIESLHRSSVLTGRTRAHEAGAIWLRDLGLSADAERIVLCSGVQHAMLATIAAITRPGDALACEALSYPGIRALANMLRLNLVPLTMDEGGLVPDAFERACVEHNLRALYCVPTAQTPTAIVMSAQRRRRIADIARRHNTLILEDDEDTPLLDNVPEPIAAIAPEHTVHMAGVEAAVASGFRVAYVLAPAALVKPIADAVRTTLWVVPPAMGHAMAYLIEQGWATRAVTARKRELELRRDLATKALADLDAPFRQGLHHCWLPLPPAWRVDQFVEHARERNVLVQSPDPFVVAGASSPRAVRLTLGAETDTGRLEEGFRIIARLLHDGPT